MENENAKTRQKILDGFWFVPVKKNYPKSEFNGVES
jgi:hypothetical protein